MPLKLVDITHPSSTNLINKYTDDNDRKTTEHSTQIKTLTTVIQDLLKKNPTLVKPNGIK